MKRAATALVLFSLLAMSAFAHGDDSHFPDPQQAGVKVTQVAGSVYLLQGRGGNIAALVGDDGILIVDDDYKALSQQISDALKKLGSPMPKFVFNTHWHGDHTEGNAFFGKDAIIVAHTNVRKRLLDPPVIFGQKTPPYVSPALPIVTYDQSLSIHFDGEEVKAMHYPSGHTDGDTVVFFTKANVVHMGDHFFFGSFPFVDLASGGSVQGLITNVGSLIKTLPADAKIIPGHGPLATLDDLKSYHAMLLETTKLITNAMKKKKSLDEIKKAGLPEKFKEAGSGFIKTDAWIETVYQSYSKK